MTFLRGSLLMISSTPIKGDALYTSITIPLDGSVRLGEDFTITIPQLIAVLKYALPKAEKDYPEEFI